MTERLTFGDPSQPHFEQQRRMQAQSLLHGLTEQLSVGATGGATATGAGAGAGGRGGGADPGAAGSLAFVAGLSARAADVTDSVAPTPASASAVTARILKTIGSTQQRAAAFNRRKPVEYRGDPRNADKSAAVS